MIDRDTQIADIAKFFHKVVCSCGAVIGQYHNEGCDVARCRKCGDQAWVSDCGKWKPDIWTGFWPGTIEALELGLFSRWGPPWIECDALHPDAGPDLNRVYALTVWDKKLGKRVLI